MRVQIPAYTDRWMMGDRYGEVVKVTRTPKTRHLYPDREVWHVRLDKSGKTLKFLGDDCREV